MLADATTVGLLGVETSTTVIAPLVIPAMYTKSYCESNVAFGSQKLEAMKPKNLTGAKPTYDGQLDKLKMQEFGLGLPQAAISMTKGNPRCILDS